MDFERQWRVHIYPKPHESDRYGASLMHFTDKCKTSSFESPEDLPQWVKKRIAVLKVLGGQEYKEGIGQRYTTQIGEIYWVDEPTTGIANELGLNPTREN